MNSMTKTFLAASALLTFTLTSLPQGRANAAQCQRYVGFGQNLSERRAADDALRGLVNAMRMDGVRRRASEVEYYCERNVLMVTCTAEALGCH